MSEWVSKEEGEGILNHKTCASDAKDLSDALLQLKLGSCTNVGDSKSDLQLMDIEFRGHQGSLTWSGINLKSPPRCWWGTDALKTVSFHRFTALNDGRSSWCPFGTFTEANRAVNPLLSTLEEILLKQSKKTKVVVTHFECYLKRGFRDTNVCWQNRAPTVWCLFE